MYVPIFKPVVGEGVVKILDLFNIGVKPVSHIEILIRDTQMNCDKIFERIEVMGKWKAIIPDYLSNEEIEKIKRDIDKGIESELLKLDENVKIIRDSADELEKRISSIRKQ